MRIQATAFKLLVLLTVVGLSSASFSYRQSLTVPSNLINQLMLCGYDAYPMVALKNGTVMVWNQQSVNFNSAQVISCFKASEQLDQSKRYVFTFPVNPPGTNSYYVSKNKGSSIEKMDWVPQLQAGSSIITMIQSPNAVVLYVLSPTATTYIRVYKNSDFTFVKDIIPSVPLIGLFVDNHDNLVAITIEEKFVVYYGKNYTGMKSADFPRNPDNLFNIRDVGSYGSGSKTSKFMLYFLNQPSIQKIQMQLIYSGAEPLSGNLKSIQAQDLKQDTLQIKFSSGENFTVFEQQVDCEDKVLTVSYESKCIKYDGSCIIDKYPSFLSCSREHSSSIDGLNRLKIIVGVTDDAKANMTFEIYEQVKVGAIILIVGLVLLVVIILVVILIVVLKKKGITFVQFITCKPCRKPKDQNYNKIDD